MTMIRVSELKGDAQRIMVKAIGVVAKMCKHTGFCLDYYGGDICDVCPVHDKCLDLFQDETEADFEKARVLEAEEKAKLETEILREELQMRQCQACCFSNICIDMAKPARGDGIISQAAEKDEYIGLCASPYIYHKCHDCLNRIACLVAYIKGNHQSVASVIWDSGSNENDDEA